MFSKQLPAAIALNECARMNPRFILPPASPRPLSDWLTHSKNELITEYPATIPHSFWQNRTTIDINQLQQQLKQDHVATDFYTATSFPARFRELHTPPLILHRLGKIYEPNRPHIAIIGSRKASGYGRICAQKFSAELARKGIVIVSGMAYGIDEIAHRSALEVGGRTMAIIGHGILHQSSQRSQKLQADIIAGHGTVFSEFAIRAPGHKSHFPFRNRLIAAIADVVLVIEASERSGTLITARLAAEFGTDVGVIPGPIHAPNAKGANRLLQEGAHVITCVQDVVDLIK